MIAILAEGSAWGAPCTPVGAGMVELWPLDKDGAGAFGVTSMSPSHAASLAPVGYGQVTVAETESGPVGGWFVASLASLPQEWTLDADLRVESGVVGDVLSLRTDDDRRIGVRFDCRHGTARLLDAAGSETTLDVPHLCEDRWVHVGLSSNGGSVTLSVGGASVGPLDEAALPAGGRRAEIRVGVLDDPPDHGELDVRDVAIHATAFAPADLDALDQRPWCAPAADRALPYHLPFRAQTFELDGYYLGLVGRVSTHEPVARQRIELRPVVQMSRYSQVVVQARLLETRGLDDSGSLLRADTVRSTTEIGDYLPVFEQAYVATHGESFVLPLYFAAGRLPTTFGLGLDDQNSFGTFDPPPSSAAATFVDEPRDEVTARPDALDDRSFGTSMDGVEEFVRLGQVDQDRGRDLWIGLRSGRHDPWCNGRTSVPCPDRTASVFEFALSALVDARLPERGGNWTLFAGVEGGRRKASLDSTSWFRGGPHGSFGRVGLLLVAPRVDAVWMRLALEGIADQSVRDPSTTPLPVELEGGVGGAAGQLDLALRRLASVTVGVGGGGAGPLLGDQPIRGLHPDFDVDLVTFSQVVADATATHAADPDVVPSMGGVWDGGYARAYASWRPMDAVEIPVAWMPAWSLGDTDAVPAGFLGHEVDGSIRIRIATWRLGAELGVLFPGEALPDYAHRHPVAWDLRLGRNL